MTNSHTPAVIKLMSKLTLPQFDAVKFYAAPKWSDKPVLSNKAPRLTTAVTLVKKGVLETDTFTYADGKQVTFYRLTAFGYELAEQIGALGEWERHTHFLTLTRVPKLQKDDRVVMLIGGREIAGEVARVVDSRTFYSYEQSSKTGEWREFARNVNQVIRVETAAVIAARGHIGAVQAAAAH